MNDSPLLSISPSSNAMKTSQAQSGTRLPQCWIMSK